MQTLENAPDRKPKHTGDYASADNAHSDVPPNQRIRVQTLIHKSGDGFIARANTLGGYAEMNREVSLLFPSLFLLIVEDPAQP